MLLILCQGNLQIIIINQIKLRHTGGPTVNTEFKLVDVPELDYLTTDNDKDGKPTPRGEICFRGNEKF